jgi:hypothetical protein
VYLSVTITASQPRNGTSAREGVDAGTPLDRVLLALSCKWAMQPVLCVLSRSRLRSALQVAPASSSDGRQVQVGGLPGLRGDSTLWRPIGPRPAPADCRAEPGARGRARLRDLRPRRDPLVLPGGSSASAAKHCAPPHNDCPYRLLVADYPEPGPDCTAGYGLRLERLVSARTSRRRPIKKEDMT